MSFLLDTNICIRFPSGQSDNVKTRLEQLTPADVVLCSVVKAELPYGAAKSTVGERTLAHLNQLFSMFKPLPFDDRSAAANGAIRADLERRGASIGANDFMIAAIAFGEQYRWGPLPVEHTVW